MEENKTKRQPIPGKINEQTMNVEQFRHSPARPKYKMQEWMWSAGAYAGVEIKDLARLNWIPAIYSNVHKFTAKWLAFAAQVVGIV